MANSEALQINLATLQKIDSSISSILDSATQVGLYEYKSDISNWDKTDIEGTLFVFMRSEKPHHGFLIMNRLNTTNLIEPVTEKLDFQDQTPFLLYRNGKGKIYGLWFYEKPSCVKIFKLLTSLSNLAINKTDKSSSIRQRSYSESNRKQQKQANAQMDIISLLSRAQDEYDKKSEAKNSTKGSKGTQHSSNGDIVKPTPVRVNGTVATSKDSTPLTIGMLFAQASNPEQKHNEESLNTGSRGRSYTANSGNLLPNNSHMNAENILQNLLSNSAHTLQHIEGKHLNEGAASCDTSSMVTRDLSAEQMMCVESLEKDLKEKLKLLSKSTSCAVKEEAIEKSHEPAKSEPIDIPILTPAMLKSSYSSVPVNSFGSFADKFEKHSDPVTASFPTVKESRSFSPNQLLSPMDFTMPCRRKIIPSSVSPDLGSSLLNGNGSNDHVSSMPNGPSSGHLIPFGKPSSVTPLNKDQFKEALVYMIQNDDDFVIQLHECYVKSLKSHLNSFNAS